MYHLVLSLLTRLVLSVCVAGLQAVPRKIVGHDHHAVSHCRHPVCLPGQCHHLAPFHSCDHKVCRAAHVGLSPGSRQRWQEPGDAGLAVREGPVLLSTGPQPVIEEPSCSGRLLGGPGDPAWMVNGRGSPGTRICGVTLGREIQFDSVPLPFIPLTSFTRQMSTIGRFPGTFWCLSCRPGHCGGPSRGADPQSVHLMCVVLEMVPQLMMALPAWTHHRQALG